MQRARTKNAKDERRKVLLKAALDEFYECGFSAARMDDIAKRATLSKGTIYLYFESKEALFTALIESLTQPAIQAIETIGQSKLNFEMAMRALAQFAPQLIRQSDIPRLMKVLIGESNTFPEIIKHYRHNVMDRVLASFTSMLAAASSRGEIDIDDPALTARLVVAPIAFSGMWQAVFASEDDVAIDLDALFQIHTSLLMKALSVKGEEL